MNENIILYNNPNNDLNKIQLLNNLRTVIGHTGSFDDEIWINKKHEGYKAGSDYKYRIHFGRIPPCFAEITKYFNLRDVKAPNTLNGRNNSLAHFFKFAKNECNITDITDISYNTINSYKKYLVDKKIDVRTKYKYWKNLQIFFEKMNGFIGMPSIIFPIDPSFAILRHKAKKEKEQRLMNGENVFLPKELFYELDRIFIDFKDVIPIHIQLIYWLLRLIPSRITEVCDMETKKCMRKFDDKILITIPVPKTSLNTQIRKKIIVLSGKSQAEKHLFNLIEKQKEITEGLQEFVKGKNGTMGLLFTCFKLDDWNESLFEKVKNKKSIINQYSDPAFNRSLKTIIQLADKVTNHFNDKVYNLRDEKGEIYKVTSHAFRHEGITSRVDYGFRIHEIMFLSGLLTEDTIWNSYYHSRPDEAIVETNPIYDYSNLFEEKLIKPSEIKIEDDFSQSIIFQGNANTDDFLLKFQIEYDHYTPIVTNEGIYLGNCPNIYDCNRIKKELKCVGCELSKDEIVQDGIESIEKAIRTYMADIEYFHTNGNIRMKNLAIDMLGQYIKRREKFLLRG